ncbi:MAG: hypothetical protein AYL29_003720 [Candidatus Bathyarchaeota archaeon B24]|nr:MAG: hypothetical protein AYL29_003720 [Candidatus Bathyarchaeota archaeon B24]
MRFRRVYEVARPDPGFVWTIRERGRDGEDLRLLASAIRVFGPRNYTAIARVTGLPVETVRYKIRRNLLGRGIRVHVHINFGALGLARYWMFLEFSEDWESRAVELLDRLARNDYIVYFGRVIPWGSFFSLLALPPKFEAKYRIFLDKLVDMGVLKSYGMTRMNWIRFFSMRIDCYDFKNATWRFEWDTLSRSDRPVAVSIEEDVQKPRIDKLDLQIAGMLQANSSITMRELARKLGVEYKRLLYHYKEHVLGRGIVKGYIVKWHGDRRWRKPLVRMVGVFNDLSPEEVEEVKEAFQDIPFTRFDAYSAASGVYLAYLVVPAEHLQGMLKYIWKTLPRLKRKMRYGFIDPECSRSYMLPLKPFDEKGGWKFSIKANLNLLYEVLNVKTLSV